MNIDPAVFYKLIWAVGLMSAVIGAAITTLAQALQAWRDREAANRRHMREIIMKGALENWKLVDQAANEAGGKRWPLDVYLVHMHKFSEVLEMKKITVEALRKNEAEGNILVDEACRIAERVSERAIQGDQGQ